VYCQKLTLSASFVTLLLVGVLHCPLVGVLHCPSEDCAGYAVSYLHTPHAMSGLRMRVGMDDTGVVYLNGQRVHQWVSNALFQPDRDTIPDLSLNEGLNVLVFKVLNGAGHWMGSIRFTDAQDNPVTGIRVSAQAPEAAAAR